MNNFLFEQNFLNILSRFLLFAGRNITGTVLKAIENIKDIQMTNGYHSKSF